MDYDNSGQDNSNFGDTYSPYDNSQDRQDNYESQHQHQHQQDHYSSSKEHDSPKAPESKSVGFNLPSSSDETTDLIDIQKDNAHSESQESTPEHELGNYENSIIDHFESAFIGPPKDTNGLTQNVARNENAATNQNYNNTQQKENDTDCCSCNSGPLMCLAIFCDCFCL